MGTLHIVRNADGTYHVRFVSSAPTQDHRTTPSVCHGEDGLREHLRGWNVQEDMIDAAWEKISETGTHTIPNISALT